MEKVAKFVNDPKTFFKILKNVESATLLETVGTNQIILVKGGKLVPGEPARESLVACHMKKMNDQNAI